MARSPAPRTPRVSPPTTSGRVGDLGLLEVGAKTLAHGQAVTRPLVVGGETRGVRGAGDLAIEDLVEGVATLAGGLATGVENGKEHEMHLG